VVGGGEGSPLPYSDVNEARTLEAEAEAEAKTHEAEAEAEAKTLEAEAKPTRPRPPVLTLLEAAVEAKIEVVAQEVEFNNSRMLKVVYI
jgi:regulator of protease activity HflC (stomatin/prohibitin superfamily)